MMNKVMIIFSGPPASGKTTLAKYLAHELNLPLFNKDQFKESMYDYLGHPDLEMHRKMGGLSYHFLFALARELASKNISFLLEAPFERESSSQLFAGLLKEFHFRAFQIQLECDGEVLIERFLARQREGRTHPGHQGEKYFHTMEEKLRKGRMEPLDIEGECMTINTTDLKTMDYKFILERMKSTLDS